MTGAAHHADGRLGDLAVTGAKWRRSDRDTTCTCTEVELCARCRGNRDYIRALYARKSVTLGSEMEHFGE